ncbi:MAG: phosphate ABC transporter ATP-binding protein [Caldilineae bacterium]|nr:MAG: phosphate ABC transporter ATP-binding protein [Caldilineae bacterium]
MSDVIYRLRGVTRVYEGRVVLRIERLDIFAGEILALVGPSGAGKSTLLRLLNFLESPDEGQIVFEDSFTLNGKPPPLPVRRRVTTVFQQPLLLNRSVAANVAYGLAVRGERGRAAAEAVSAALAAVGLQHLADAPARRLSGGEAQRVALARALVIRPHVLLLDEPTANLDPYNVKLIEAIVRQTNAEHGTTVVLVTHNIFQARRLAHRTGLLLEGRLIEVADSPTFFQSPADPRTAAFVRGEMVY